MVAYACLLGLCHKLAAAPPSMLKENNIPDLAWVAWLLTASVS